MYEIEMDPQTKLPVRIRMVLCTAIRGETETNKAKKIVGGRHVAFQFDYTLSDYGKVEKTSVPVAAMKLLARD